VNIFVVSARIAAFQTSAFVSLLEYCAPLLNIACNTHYFIGYQGGAQFMSCRLGCLLSLVVGSRTMLLHVCRTSMANLAYIG
jgi:hypothetical protein